MKISSLYTLGFEDVCVRLLYVFNTINTYYLIAGISTFIILDFSSINWVTSIVILVTVVVLIKISDFYPLFLIPTIPAMFFVALNSTKTMWYVGKLLMVNALIYYCVLIFLMAIPESIVARDCIKVLIKKLWNVTVTVAPTSVSLSMSLFFSMYLSFALSYMPGFNFDDVLNGTVFWAASVAGALLAYLLKPRTYVSKFMKPPIKEMIFKRVVVLNIDGCRMDVLRGMLKSKELPNIRKAIESGTSYPNGLTTVYRALTNPAFASILTGTTPNVHGIKDNNIGQEIKVEGLPDIVPTILYGSMHVKHFSKKHWKTKIVSLPRHSVYKADSIVQKMMFEDLLSEKATRLFVMDYSEADFLGHAYGSKSSEYKMALRSIDKKIGEVFEFLGNNSMSNDAAVIICSDHGIVAIDHSYLLFDAEKYVPFIAVGKGICQGKTVEKKASIADISMTISYLLGVKYTNKSHGKVLVDILEDSVGVEDAVVRSVNQAYYAAVARNYDIDHPEVLEGDLNWWIKKIKSITNGTNKHWKVLDFGCGTGFVGTAFKAAGCNLDRFVCYDVSKNMIEEAQKRLSDKEYYFTDDLGEIQKDRYDIICINSVLHHLHDVKLSVKLLQEMLVEGGYIIGAHEPNRQFFKNRLVRIIAGFYKIIGCGFKLKPEIVNAVNLNLQQIDKDYSQMSAMEILQTVENHSPVEQSIYGIDQNVGFDKKTLVNILFKDLKVYNIETYTTAFIRRKIKHLPYFRVCCEYLFYRFFGSGNLIRYVFQKI